MHLSKGLDERHIGRRGGLLQHLQEDCCRLLPAHRKESLGSRLAERLVGEEFFQQRDGAVTGHQVELMDEEALDLFVLGSRDRCQKVFLQKGLFFFFAFLRGITGHAVDGHAGGGVIARAGGDDQGGQLGKTFVSQGEKFIHQPVAI